MTQDEYRQSVVTDFKTRGFTESSFKGSDHWTEVLDPSWNWDKFDYRVPNYDKSKSSGEIINNVEHFVNTFTQNS